jgi:uncharacterized repeat protein (TIGR03806 family)
MKSILSFAILVVLFSALILGPGCSGVSTPPVIIEETFEWDVSGMGVPEYLSEYGLFEQPLHTIIPKSGVIEYELNSSLFTDYAWKKRFIYLPEGTQMAFHPDEAFNFPEGSLIFKFFYYPADFNRPEEAIQHIETRVLKFANGEWQAFPYVWNEEQTDARLDIAGSRRMVSWLDEKGIKKEVHYAVPGMIQCKTCHEFNGKMVPIGPAARHLNREFDFPEGRINQLVHFQKSGLLKDMPDLKDCDRLASWEDPDSGSLEVRARAYLDINCAHCHRKEGPARNSVLNLLASENNPAAIGIGKTPIAAGRGSGGFRYDIVPGKPEASIMVYRMKSNEPGIMMPEIGRKIPHEEGIALIEEWIAGMKSR